LRRRYVKRVAYDAVFSALALSMFVLEQAVPLPLPVPGVKLGLSNIVSLFAMFALSPLDAAVILMVRIVLGSLFAGTMTAFLYSLAGGVTCYVVTLLLRFILSPRQIWVAGALGAVVHVSAQVVVAYLLTDTVQVFYYLPILVSISVVTGLFTGFLAQFTYRRTIPFFADYHSRAPRAD
jgi:heptaprenyl diphosphate synthase